MSGHNKWSKIKHKKALTDAKKSKVFTKYARLIASESKKCGGDISSPALKAVVESAKAINMPKDNIERAVQKGKAGDSEDLERVLYEAYGPGGAALIIAGYTDNRNRTAQEVKHILTKEGYALASPGAASWAFEKIGEEFSPVTAAPISEEDGEKLSALIDALEEQSDINEIFTNAE